MRSAIFPSFMLALFGGIVSSGAILSFWTDGTTEFAVGLYKSICSSDSADNVIYSPLSATLILGMVQLGAKGKTQKQLKEALKLQGTEESEELSGFRTLFSAISDKNKEFAFTLASALYFQDGFSVKEEYLHSNKDFFQSDIKLVNFQDAKTTAEAINAWVESKTQGQIHNLISSEDFGALTKLVLLNAIYFRGEWKYKFRPENTHLMEFTKKHGSVTKIPTMHLQLRTKIGTFSDMDVSYQVLELPYKGEAISLILVLPAERVTIEEMEKVITADLIKAWISEMEEEEVEVSLPRFKIEHKLDLKKSLPMLNVTEIFNHGCDLSGITESADIYVSKVVQKVSIEINEDGSEAAASTGMDISAMSMARYQFLANRPFMFIIKDNLLGSILFMGKLTNPDTKIARGRDMDSL
ncbi:serpin I2 isoform X2 [Lissotriton helveticus]